MAWMLDHEKLRRDLMDYYGTAMVSGFPMAMMELGRVERASDWELEEMAKKTDLNMEKYWINH